MIGLVFRRIIAAIPILLITSIGVFLLASLVPGDAATTLAGGQNATQEQVAQIRKDLHLNDPLLVQYGRWLGRASHFDLGKSLYSKKTVASEIRHRLAVTLSLAVSALVVALVVGIPLGMISGVRPGSRYDQGARIVSTLGVAIPSFVLAIGLVVLFSVRHRILPPAGYVPITEAPVRFLRYMALPALTLGIGLAASIARQLRGSLIDVLDSDYIRVAWAKGATPRVVVAKHALKNAAVPALTVLGLQFGYLLGGTVIVEQIFSIPGLGNLMLRSITGSDLPVIQGLALVFVIGQITMSLLVDIGYGFLNPKVRATSG
jgi:peptide/nickel transport system permease protein